MAVNTWAVAILRYSAGIVEWRSQMMSYWSWIETLGK